NGPGESSPATFKIYTKSPTVTLDELPTPSSNRAPSFAGAASDVEPVTVEVYVGKTTEGTPVVTKVSAAVVEEQWFAPAVTPRLEFGEYTAVATERSSLGNPEGRSKQFTFVVAPIPPSVITEGA